MTKILEGRYDEENVTPTALDEAVETILRDYRRNVELPAQAKSEAGREGKMNLLDSLFTPQTDEELAIEAQEIQDARERGYVRHEGADGYTYVCTPKGSVMLTPEYDAIVRLN